jgi:NAD(P)-dependent dehydrogenase (short-subunit alcohol dehydrogenase family)
MLRHLGSGRMSCSVDAARSTDDRRPWHAALALELAPVRVNLIAAGFVDTPIGAEQDVIELLTRERGRLEALARALLERETLDPNLRRISVPGSSCPNPMPRWPTPTLASRPQQTWALRPRRNSHRALNLSHTKLAAGGFRVTRAATRVIM